ncbi:MAG TPA: VanW family protein [Marmoricola sp.]|nr:VanW family protein [Marmoricola sp.]
MSSLFGPDRDDHDETGDSGDTGAGTERGHRDRNLLRWLFVVVLAVVAAVYLAGYAFASDRLPQGTEVAGVDVGGRHPDEARRDLARELRPRLDDPVELVVGSRTFSVDPEASGLDVDVAASVAQVPVGRSWNPADMWENLVGGGEYDAVVITIDDLLTNRLEEIAQKVAEPAVEGGVRFTRSGAEPTYPDAGRVLDVEAAEAAVTAAYPSGGEPVELERVVDEPEITSDEVGRAMKEFANPAMSAPVTYTVGGEPVVLQPSRFARALSMRAEDGELVPAVDTKVLRKVFRPAMVTLAAKPRNATVEIVDGRPRVVPAKNGVSIDWDRVERSFLRLVTAEEGKRELEMPTALKRPERTTKEARELGIVEEVSEFTTYYPHADYRNINIGRAAELIDGTILEPGETFSLNETVGERTAENGFAQGTIISNGVFKEDFGGGVSQVATTTFNAAFFAGLEDVEHKPHSFYIDRYPVGREATVAWPVVDLRFKNDTDHGVLIQTVHTPSSFSNQGALTVRMWSTKVWDIESITGERYAFTSPETRVLTGEECIPNDGYGGFQIDVTRVFRRPGESEVVRREVMHTTYTPSDTVVCR